MATYKVIQDIEAEDKLLGPLTMRQFIYAVAVLVLGYFDFRLLLVKWFLAIPLLAPMALLAVLAAPFGHDQSSEVWLLAKIRFFLKPRRRIWNQSGIKELVTITAPKHPEYIYTNGLSQMEVRSRLRALADTIDSRGWAVKNTNVNLFTQPGYVADRESDRLVGPSSLPQEVATVDVQASDDILDPQSNPVAHQLDEMIVASEQAHRQQVLAGLNGANQAAAGPPTQPPTDYWFMQTPPVGSPDPSLATFTQPQVMAPGSTPTPTPVLTPTEEQAVLAQMHPDFNEPAIAYGHLKTIQPMSARPINNRQPAMSNQQPSGTNSTNPQTNPPTVTDHPRPGILELAKNDDFTVATIARQAKRQTEGELPDGEVVINLH